MTSRALFLILGLLSLGLLVACPDEGDDDDSTAPTGDDDDTTAAPSEDPLVPSRGEIEAVDLDCTGAYTLPEEFTGDEGLGYHGWELEDLTFQGAWSVPTTDKTDWISDNYDEGASLRIRPWLVPEAGYCHLERLTDATGGAAAGDAVVEWSLEEMTAFGHPWDYYDELSRDRYTPDEVDLDVPMVVMRAVAGLMALDNEIPGAPDGDTFDDELRDELVAATADYPPEFSAALADLVLAVGEAHLLKVKTFENGAWEDFERMFDQFQAEMWRSQTSAMMGPVGGTFFEDVEATKDALAERKMYGAGLRVSGAADELRRALDGVTPFDSPGIDVLTPHGRILVDTTGADTTWTREQLADAAIVVDLGGDDVYHGRYAASHEFWMSAGVLVDASGNDLYSPDVADIESDETTDLEAFDAEGGFTQGCGLFGVGVLVDGGGDDVYTATTHAQGNGAFGVGVLYDRDGTDIYRLGTTGQGTGYWGLGMLVDGGGDDYYGVYTMGQGAGKPRGHGLLLDLDGHDTYIGYYNDYQEWLPAPGFNNYHGLGFTWPYSDDEGKPHYMSICQGVGWGFRGDWMDDGTNRAGGYGALIDLGEGDDQHYADCMSQGHGFVYGYGFLYDGGGDDIYRTFWWGPAASPHMGTNLFVEEGGNDDIHVIALSGGYGYDWSIGWTLDNAGDDIYSGQFNYGRAYLHSMTFMINTGGDDIYNDGAQQGSPHFGIVDGGYSSRVHIGVFMDLGAGDDTYNTTHDQVTNDAVWYNEPIGDGINADNHKGIGMDR